MNGNIPSWLNTASTALTFSVVVSVMFYSVGSMV
jgi:hypothetical protein